MLVNEPVTPRLEVRVQLTDVFLGLWDAAKTHDRDNSVNASLCDETRGADVLNADGDYFISTFKASLANALPQGRVVVGVRLDTIDLNHGSSVPAIDLASPMLNKILVGKDADPVATAGADFDHRSADTRGKGDAIVVCNNRTSAHPSLKERHHTGFSSLAYHGTSKAPKVGKPDVAELVKGRKSSPVVLADNLEDRGRKVGGREAKEHYRFPQAVEDVKSVDHCESNATVWRVVQMEVRVDER